MAKNPWEWTKEDLEKLIGQSETLKLEFKDSRLFDSSSNKIVDELTKEVSAFANTVGGVLVIGISERRDGKSRIADHIDDGVDSKAWYKERLQQLIEANLSPYLSGIRINMIHLDHMSQGSAIIVYVPEGNTAYQASDRKYYGRSEFEAKALPDHEIRLRMFKGKSSAGSVILDNKVIYKTSVSLYSSGSALVRKTLQDRNEEWIDIFHYSFSVSIQNAGEIDITGFKLIIKLKPETIRKGNNRNYWRYYDGMETDTHDENYDPEFSDKIITVKMYPADTFYISHFDLETPCDISLKDLDATLDWELFLSNRMPITGRVDLADEFSDVEIYQG